MVACDSEFHPNVCHVWPAATVIEHRCSSPDCKKLHAIEFALGWFWHSISITWIFDDTVEIHDDYEMPDC